MKALKKIVIDDILSTVNTSPFLIVIDYAGMKVAQFQELRKRLAATGAKLQVAKNTCLLYTSPSPRD